ncbi:hypothetical protein RISK_004899 [Rhodopirellula islandica]|uniref:Uncharacterized protein n=1 Tax=Rhodopirellula islandica TaxID=595434 RepID=A0A0J1B9C8_RHOIS|nr:hypothetical protein RISK_004899 [Rhodopirellula islandica]
MSVGLATAVCCRLALFQSVGVGAMWDMAYGRQPNSGESGYESTWLL